MRCWSGSAREKVCSHSGAASSGKNEPLRNAIGSTMKFAALTAPSVVLVIAPASRPSDMKQSVPTTSSGMLIHHDPVSVSPNAAAPSPMKIASWTSAIPTVTETRAPTTVRVETGASWSRRISLDCRQPWSVAAAPKAALIAIAQPSRPGVTNWMVLSESSSTRSVSSEYVGG